MPKIRMGKRTALGARLKAGALAAALAAMAGVGLQMAPAQAFPGEHGCVALAHKQSSTSCLFTGLSGGVAPTGVISGTDASWTITHGSGATTVTDASGTGPGIASIGFTNGVFYELTVGPGTGAITAGTPE